MSAEHYSLSDIRVDERIVPEHNYYKYSKAGNVGTYDPEMYMIYNVESGEQAYQTVLRTAGTIRRDAVEKRVVEEATTGVNLYGGATYGAKKGIMTPRLIVKASYSMPPTTLCRQTPMATAFPTTGSASMVSILKWQTRIWSMPRDTRRLRYISTV